MCVCVLNLLVFVPQVSAPVVVEVGVDSEEEDVVETEEEDEAGLEEDEAVEVMSYDPKLLISFL